MNCGFYSQTTGLARRVPTVHKIVMSYYVQERTAWPLTIVRLRRLHSSSGKFHNDGSRLLEENVKRAFTKAGGEEG
jgi:hypothetical protein